jgi:hypothetical protein
MGPKHSVEKLPEKEAYMQTNQDMRSASSGFHILELHLNTAVKTSVTILALLGIAAAVFWWVSRRSARMEAARRMARQPTLVEMEMAPMVTGYGAGLQPEARIMELREAEQPRAMVAAIPRQSALGFIPRVV